ncbi:MAG TPA: hypothetical protein VD772_10195, partial [Anseongella sp.]|nr:hypothetical protein [Anseongella sp.]
MKELLLMLSLALAGLSASAQVTLQERAYKMDASFKFIVTSDMDKQGNVMLSGLIRKASVPGSSYTPHDNYLLLLKPDTDTLWTRKGIEVVDYFAYPGVRMLRDGGFAFASTIKGPNTTTDLLDVVLQKRDSKGGVLMSRTYNPAMDYNTVHSFLAMPDKGYLLMGYGG